MKIIAFHVALWIECMILKQVVFGIKFPLRFFGSVRFFFFSPFVFLMILVVSNNRPHNIQKTWICCAFGGTPTWSVLGLLLSLESLFPSFHINFVKFSWHNSTSDV